MPTAQQQLLLWMAVMLSASCMAAQVLAAAAAAAAPAADSALPGLHDAPSDAVVEWVRQHGGEVNVAIRQLPDKGRSTFAVRDMQKGDVLARIPIELAYVANHTWGPGNEAAGAQLLLDMADEQNFWRPMFSALPAKQDVFTHLFIPEPYLPILQDADAERVLVWSRETVQQYWEMLNPTFSQLGLNYTVADCLYGMALMITRAFSYHNTSVLLPVIDQSNHDNACQHTHRLEPCDPDKGLEQWQYGLTPPSDPSTWGAGNLAGAAGGGKGGCAAGDAGTCTAAGPAPSGVCIAWRAETPVSRGQEVCNTYGTMTNDRSLLQYGFLQAGAAIELSLMMMDRPERPAGVDGVWHELDAAWGQGLPLPFAGTTALELRDEAARLTARLTELRAGDDALAAIQPDASADPDGRILALLRTWRQQRLLAIEMELETLKEEADGLGLDTV